MIDPVWKLARRSLGAGLRNGDLKETCLAEEWVGAVAFSGAFYQSADERLKDRVVFAIVQARWWTLQRLQDGKLCSNGSVVHDTQLQQQFGLGCRLSYTALCILSLSVQARGKNKLLDQADL